MTGLVHASAASLPQLQRAVASACRPAKPGLHTRPCGRWNVLSRTERKFQAGPGEATENHFTFASGGWGTPQTPTD